MGCGPGKRHHSRTLSDHRRGGRQVGDVVWRTVPGSSDLVQDIVAATEMVLAEGLFNVFTNEGAACPPRWKPVTPAGLVRFACTCAPLTACARLTRARHAPPTDRTRMLEC